MTTNEAEAVEVRCPDCDAVLDPNPYYPGRYFPCLSKACQGDALGYTSRGDVHLMAVTAPGVR